jgi:septal ring factor EnvC (AmiA/AmiB activator)
MIMRFQNEFKKGILQTLRRDYPVIEDMRCLDPNTTAQLEEHIVELNQDYRKLAQRYSSLQSELTSAKYKIAENKEEITELEKRKNEECFWVGLVCLLMGMAVSGVMTLAFAS